MLGKVLSYERGYNLILRGSFSSSYVTGLAAMVLYVSVAFLEYSTDSGGEPGSLSCRGSHNVVLYSCLSLDLYIYFLTINTTV